MHPFQSLHHAKSPLLKISTPKRPKKNNLTSSSQKHPFNFNLHCRLNSFSFPHAYARNRNALMSFTFRLHSLFYIATPRLVLDPILYFICCSTPAFLLSFAVPAFTSRFCSPHALPPILIFASYFYSFYLIFFSETLFGNESRRLFLFHHFCFPIFQFLFLTFFFIRLKSRRMLCFVS